MASGSYNNPTYDYVAYIDESGDPGLATVKPIDAEGSAEWLVISAVVIPAELENRTDGWVKDILRRIGSRHRSDIHFNLLSPKEKVIASSSLLSHNLRAFVVCSNKKNMRGHHNPQAAAMGNVDWFYAWMTRIILERVTHFVAVKSLERYKEVRRVKIVFSERGGLSVPQMGAYYDWIKQQSRNNNLFLPWGDLDWETLHLNLLRVKPHQRTPGLQLADIVASSFFKACDKYDTGECNNLYARILEPIVARFPDANNRLRASGYGVKLLPNLKDAKLEKEQQGVFLCYGYPFQLWQDKREWDIVPPWKKNRGVAGPSDPKVF